MKLVLTCEHAGNHIPDIYKRHFTGAGTLLSSHRGMDPGALDLFRRLEHLAAFSACHMPSRLLVEVNRSVNHRQVFSEFTRNLTEPEKKQLLQAYYFPYRNNVEQGIRNLIQHGEKILHISVHSFTPELDGKIRKADIGLLYDPARPEKQFCARFKDELLRQAPGLKIRYNYPYRGISDGFTTALRRIFPQHYLGIELEVNQRFAENNRMEEGIKKTIEAAVYRLLS